jgi:hypothetical protein
VSPRSAAAERVGGDQPPVVVDEQLGVVAALEGGAEHGIGEAGWMGMRAKVGGRAARSGAPA